MSAPAPTEVIFLTCEYPPFPGGIGTYSGRVVEAVRRGGFKATVIAPNYPSLPTPKAEPDTARILDHHSISPKAALSVLGILRRTPRSAPVLAADIRTVLLAWVLKPLHRRPYRAMIHGSEVSKFRPGTPMFNIVRQAYRGAERILSNSQATLDIFTGTFGPPRDGLVSYLGVEPHWFEAPSGPFEDPLLSALPEDAAVICSVGRIEPRKGQLETVRAIALSRESHDLGEAVFVMVGRPEDQAYTRAVSEEADRLGVQMVAPGRISDEDMKRLFQRAACHVLFAQPLPGKIEGFGLVLLEAAAQSCPSVASAIGGIPEVMAETGVLVDPNDVDALAVAIARYAADVKIRAEDGERARDRATTFDWLCCAQHTFEELPWSSVPPADELATVSHLRIKTSRDGVG